MCGQKNLFMCASFYVESQVLYCKYLVHTICYWVAYSTLYIYVGLVFVELAILF